MTSIRKGAIGILIAALVVFAGALIEAPVAVPSLASPSSSPAPSPIKQLAGDKYSVTVDGETVIVGKDGSTFSPEVLMYKWGNEVWMGLGEPTVNGAALSQKNAHAITDGSTITWASKDLTFRFYPVDSATVSSLSGQSFEYEIVLANSKAGTDTLLSGITWPLQSSGLEFWFQPPLTAEEVARGDYQPEDMVGSYAVYRTTTATIMGDSAYGIGKAFHIPRPKLIDNAGSTAWADLIIDPGLGTFTLDFTQIAAWLNKAKYPVIVDPTIGYTSEPTGGTTSAEGQIVGVNGTSPEAGTVSSISAYIEVLTAIHNMKAALYRASDYALVASTEQVAVPVQARTLTTFNFASPPAITAQAYVIVVWADAAPSGNAVVWRDSVGGYTRYLQGIAYNGFPDPLVPATAGSVAHGIYATYSTGVSTPTVTTQAGSSVWTTAAIGNGNITDTGGENNTARGFQWDTDTGAPYANTVTENGSFGSGAFDLLLGSLPAATTIYYRAYSTNSAGTGYGGEQSFTTRTAGTLESWTADYTTVDTSVRITTKTAAEITVADVDKGDDLYTYRDFGAGYWVSSEGKWAWDIDFMMPTGFSGPSDHLTFIGVANAAHAVFGSDPLIMVYGYYEASFPVDERLRVYLKVYDTANAIDYLESLPVTLNTTYYPILYVHDGLVDLDLYSDTGHTTLLGSLSSTAGTTKLRYISNMNSRSGGDVPLAGDAPGSVYNFSLASATGAALSVPTVVTNAATSVEATTATLNGNVTGDGGATVTRRGFQYDTDSGAPYASSQYEDGSFGTGVFDENIIGLPTGTTIYFRAFAVNSEGTGYGAESTLLTKPAAPTNVAATDGSDTSKVVVTWTQSTGATGYRVYRDAADVSGLLGAVATYDDSGAAAPTVTPGTASATDGTDTSEVTLSIAGASANVGTTHTYYVVAVNATGNSANSASNTGYRGVGALTYQWRVSAADSDAAYGDIVGGTTAPYSYTSAPAPSITAGTANASDGTSTSVVTLSIAGESASVGAGRWYYAVVGATGAVSQDTTHNRGYMGVGALLYQWQRSAADSDAAYSNIAGGTADPYDDTGGVYSPDGRYYRANLTAAGAAPQTTNANRGYMAVGAPTVTNSTGASLITNNTARLNGEVTATGGENPTVYIYWGNDDAGTVALNWDNEVSLGILGLGAFNTDIAGLIANTTYYYRSYASNSSGGSWAATTSSFVTLPGALPPPTNFTATDAGGSTANLSWVKGAGATNTLIRVSRTAFPTSVTDGEQVYFSNGTSTTHTGLSLDTSTYYYSAWSENGSGTYSVDYATAQIGGEGMVLLALSILGVGLTVGMIAAHSMLLGFPAAIFWALLGGYAFSQSAGWPDWWALLGFGALLGMVPFSIYAAYGLRERRDTNAASDDEEEAEDEEDALEDSDDDSDRRGRSQRTTKTRGRRRVNI